MIVGTACDADDESIPNTTGASPYLPTLPTPMARRFRARDVPPTLGSDPPPICPACGGTLGPWQEGQTSPLLLRIVRLVRQAFWSRVDSTRRRLYL